MLPTPSRSSRLHGPFGKSHGFALVVALVLMAMILLLLLSLTSMVAVESGVSSVHQRQLEARSNALLALQVAVGELQRNTGPDTRVTARAAVLDAQPATEIIEGVENPYWTGVWRWNSATGDRELLTWLVSGNASLDLSSVDFLSAQTSQLDDTNSVELVGSGTTGTGASNANVRAKTVATHNGNYAYWVSGEQDKAKINQVDDSVTALTGSDDFPRTLARQYQFSHLGVTSTTMLPEAANNAYDMASMPVAMGLASSAENQFKAYFHDVTTGSMGLLTDVVAGGLKVDLTALLEADALPADYDGEPIYEATAAIAGDSLATQSPTWNYLKSYYDLREDILADGMLTPRPGTDDTVGISPVIAMFSYGLSGGLYVDDSDPANADNNRTFIGITPKVVLYNPYSVTLKAKDYGLVFLANQIAQGESIGSFGYRVPVFIGSYAVQTAGGGYDANWRPYESGRTFTSGQYSDANNRTNKEKPGQPPAILPSGAPKFLVQCPDIPPGAALVFMPEGRSNFDRYWDRGVVTNVMTNNNDEMAFRWFTRSYLSETATPSVQWFRLNTNKDVYLDVALIDSDYLIDYNNPTVSDYWYSIYGTGDQKFLKRQATSDFNDHVYQMSGRVVVRNADFLAPSDPRVTNTYGVADLYAPELVAWAGFSYMTQSAGHDGKYRPFVNFNPRARDLDAANIADSDGNFVHSFFKGYGGDPSQMPTMDFYDSGTKTYLGGGYQTSEDGVENVILYDVPAKAEGLFSLGQLQHMKVSDHFDEPAYAIGNSWASPLIARDAIYRQGQGDAHGLADYLGNLDYSNVDLSYYLNEALWDKYYFSTLRRIGDPGDADFHEPYNPQIRFLGLPAADLAYDDAAVNAEYLAVNGAFNVNSTSVVAWEAVLSALNGIVLPSIDSAPLAYPFFRFLDPAYNSDDPWAGFRELTATEIHDLAVAVVEQIKMRGPALSLADFVNRQLIAEASDTNNLGVSGALQTAIDRTTINDLALGEDVTADNVVDFPVPSHALGNTADGVAGFLSQADILTALGPLLTARSDTFLIRCYGDATNELTGAIEGRVWCEAVVQRLPEYVDSVANSPDEMSGSLTATNELYGRRFKIVSFRWLSEDEV